MKSYFFSLLSALEPEAANDYTKNIFDVDEEESDDANDDQIGGKSDNATTPYVMYLANVPVEMPNVNFFLCSNWRQTLAAAVRRAKNAKNPRIKKFLKKNIKNS